MNTNKRILAIMEFVLILPAALFLTAVLARQLQPPQYEPAHTAQLIITWYSVRYWTLWVLLIGLPLAALLTGCVALLRNWNQDNELRQATRQPFGSIHLHPATLIIVAAILAAVIILTVVALHMLAN